MGRPLKTLVNLLNRNSYVRGAKNVRNRLIDHSFRSRGRAAGYEAAETLRGDGRNGLCVAIAFNTPWVIDILSASWSRYVPDLTLVVADNSSKPAARAAIKGICDARGLTYVPLPWNPEWSPNRSHGIAMNWMYYNLVRHVRPAIFGYIDHDCFPISPTGIPASMAGKLVYGRRRQTARQDGAWHLWAGFCFFRFSAVEHIELDFKHRIEYGLDTGGGNWPELYGRLLPSDILAATDHEIELTVGNVSASHDLFDGKFLHIQGASYRSKFDEEKYREALSDHIWDTYLGGRSDRLVQP